MASRGGTGSHGIPSVASCSRMSACSLDAAAHDENRRSLLVRRQWRRPQRCVSPAGGELQRFAIAVVAAQEADVYMIDEPSSYLDVRQRLKAARVGACAACPLTVRQQWCSALSAYWDIWPLCLEIYTLCGSCVLNCPITLENC